MSISNATYRDVTHSGEKHIVLVRLLRFLPLLAANANAQCAKCGPEISCVVCTINLQLLLLIFLFYLSLSTTEFNGAAEDAELLRCSIKNRVIPSDLLDEVLR